MQGRRRGGAPASDSSTMRRRKPLGSRCGSRRLDVRARKSRSAAFSPGAARPRPACRAGRAALSPTLPCSPARSAASSPGAPRPRLARRAGSTPLSVRPSALPHPAAWRAAAGRAPAATRAFERSIAAGRHQSEPWAGAQQRGCARVSGGRRASDLKTGPGPGHLPVVRPGHRRAGQEPPGPRGVKHHQAPRTGATLTLTPPSRAPAPGRAP